MTNQRQQGGDRSTNLQGETVIYHNNGPSYSETREMVKDFFKANALELAGSIARSVADERCEAWSNKFLLKLQRVSPGLFSALQDPDIQYSLFSAQRDFARSGDELLGETLADLLVLCCQTEPQTLHRLVLNEAIATLPKLTNAQVNILTVIWYLTQTDEPKIKDVGSLSREWSRVLRPFLVGMTTSKSDLDHLLYAGCVRFQMGQNTVWDLTMRSYGQFFSRGLTEASVPERLVGYWNDDRFFKPCIRDPRLKRVAQESEMFHENSTSLVPNDGSSYELDELRRMNYPSKDEFVAEMSTGFPDFADLCDKWDNSRMCTSDLSTVGVAIAHSNSARLHGPDENAALEVWLY